MSRLRKLDSAVRESEGGPTLLDKSDLAHALAVEMVADVVALTAKSPLDRSPKKNWVENSGGLPKEIEKLAVRLNGKGMTVSRAIATAISRAKRWAATSKDPKVRAKWGKAVAQWEALKAKNKAKGAAKKVS